MAQGVIPGHRSLARRLSRKEQIMSATLALRRRRFLQATAGLAMLPAAARARVCAAPPNADAIGKAVTEARDRYAGLTEGKNADYIPYLAGIPSALFGVAASAPDGT